MKARIQKISKYRPSIFQQRLHFGARRVSLTAEHPLERTAFRVLVFFLAILAFCYIYFVGMSILNVIARKDALAEVANLRSTVAALEREYFATSQQISPEEGDRLGLVPVSKMLYLQRPHALSAGKTQGEAGTLGSNEI